MDAQTIRPFIDQYAKNLRKRINISKILLYGSVAQGKATDNSDVDILVLSDDFISLDADERGQILYRASVGFPYDLHAIGLTSEEYIHASPLTTAGAIRNTETIAVT